MEINNKQDRILAYQTASVLSDNELEQVSGGSSIRWTTKFSGSQVGFDVCIDGYM